MPSTATARLIIIKPFGNKCSRIELRWIADDADKLFEFPAANAGWLQLR